MSCPDMTCRAVSRVMLLVSLVLVTVLGTACNSESDEIIWSMIHVSGSRFSGDAHLLEFPDGHVVLIDTGFNRYTERDVNPYLEQRGISHLDQLIITHAHKNHYEGIKSLLARMSGIGSVYFNLPPREACDRETWPSGCDYEHVLKTRERIRQQGIPLLDLDEDQVLYHDDQRGILLQVVYVHDGESAPVGETDINDTSAIMRLSYGAIKVLFTGDVNIRVGKYLAQSGKDLNAAIISAPHHGVESAAPDSFLDRTGAEVMMVSNSAGHWLGDRGERMRRFAAIRGVRAYVTGIDGTVVVRLSSGDYQVQGIETSPGK